MLCFRPNRSVLLCTSNIKCIACNGSHHRLLHRDNLVRRDNVGKLSSTLSQLSLGVANGTEGVVSHTTALTTSTVNRVSTCALDASKSVFLATAVVNIDSASGNELIRVCFD